MATTLVDWLNDGTIPQNKGSGSWTPSQFNTGKFRFTLTFAAASTGSPWRPASLTYWGILTTNEANGSGIWLEYNPSGTQHRLLFVASDGATNLAAVTLTWGATSAVTVTVDQSSATAGASTLTLSGASSGNGTSAGWTRASVFSGTGLYFGGWGSGGFLLPAGSVTTSDIDDANDAVTLSRTASVDGTVSIATGRTLTAIRSAAVAGVGAATATAQKTAIRSAAVAATAAIASSRVVTAVRSAAVTGAASISTGAANTKLRTAAIAAAASIACVASVTPGARVAATGAITAVAYRSTARTASVAATASISIAASVTPGGFVRTASVSGTGAIAVSSFARTLPRTASVSGAASIATAQARTLFRSLAVSATGAISATGSASSFAPGVSSSAIDEFGHGSATLSAPGGYLPAGGGGADVDGRTPTAVNTQTSGSLITYAVGRPNSVASTAITDNKTGNTYTERANGNYGLGAGASWKNSVGSALNVNGGTNHILTTQGVAGDEATLAWSEWRGARYIADTQHAFVASGSTQISPAVTLTGPGWVEVDWFGDGNTFGVEDFDWTVTASGEGTALGEWNVVDSRTRNHPNGWIQWKRWRKYFATPPASTSDTRLTLSSLTPAQGADWYATAIQAAPTATRSASVSATGAVTTAATVTHYFSRTASVAATGAISSTAKRDLRRVATVASVGSIAAVAPVQRLRTASVSAACSIATAQARTLMRTASVGAACSIVLSADREGPGAQQFNRTADVSAVGSIIAAAPVRTLVRSASIAGAASISAVASVQRLFTRTADIAGACSIATARTVTSFRSAGVAGTGSIVAVLASNVSVLPRRFTVTIGTAPVADFTVEAEP